MSIILPPQYGVSTHAAERFIERIIGQEEYTDDDIEVARLIIYNILSRRALKAKKIDQYLVRITYSNGVFIYDADRNMIVTIYPDEKAREKIKWEYKFPAGLRFERVGDKSKVYLLTKGFEPIKKEGDFLIGKININDQIFCYDRRNNSIKTL